jgi:hypothetical protein
LSAGNIWPAGKKQPAGEPVKKPALVDDDLEGPEIPTFLKRKGFR